MTELTEIEAIDYFRAEVVKRERDRDKVLAAQRKQWREPREPRDEAFIAAQMARYDAETQQMKESIERWEKESEHAGA